MVRSAKDQKQQKIEETSKRSDNATSTPLSSHSATNPEKQTLFQSDSLSKMATDAVSKPNDVRNTSAGLQQMPPDNNPMSEMAQAIKDMSQTLNQFMSSNNYYDDDALLYEEDDYEIPAGEDIEDEATENELLGFANDGTPVTRSKRKLEKDVALPNKKLRALEFMRTEANTEEAKGPNINQMLADNVTNFMRNRPDDSKLSKTMENYVPPENCPGLETIKVNESIWRKISHEARSQDLKMQKAHTALIKGTTALVQLVDTLVKDWDADKGSLSEESFHKIMENATNSLKILGGCNFEISMRRREFLRSAIAPDFAHLCSASAPFTSKLFGEDVVRTIKELSDVNKVTSQVFHRRGSGYEYRGRGRARGRGYGSRGDAKGGPYKGRGRGRGQRRPYRQPAQQQQGDSSSSSLNQS